MEVVAPGDGTEYGGVYLFFPNSGVLPSSVFWSTFQVVPVDVDCTYIDTRSWAGGDPDEAAARMSDMFPNPGAGPEDGTLERPLSLDAINVHSMQSGNFHLEDMWICERIQTSMRSPAFEVGPMARDVESALTFFQRNILDYLEAAARSR